jgi:hypothetical protein
MKFVDGTKALDLGNETHPVEEIADGFRINRAALERMNPVLCGRHKVTGVVLIQKELKPYETSSYDGLHRYK